MGSAANPGFAIPARRACCRLIGLATLAWPLSRSGGMRAKAGTGSNHSDDAGPRPA